MGNELQGQSILDVVDKYEDYGFTSQSDAYDYISNTIEKLRKILFSE